LIKSLGNGFFDSYVNTFILIENIKVFRRLINDLIKSPNIVSTEINIINFIRKYGKGEASFTTDEFGNPYKVFHADGDHSFTFLFESLYENILDDKYVMNYRNYIKFRNIVKNLSNNELENEYHKLNRYKIGNTSTKFRSKLLNNGKNKLSPQLRKFLNKQYQQRIINKPENIVPSNTRVNVQSNEIVNVQKPNTRVIEDFPSMGTAKKVNQQKQKNRNAIHQETIKKAQAAAKALKNAKSSQLNP
jgi:hypothetical protein